MTLQQEIFSWCKLALSTLLKNISKKQIHPTISLHKYIMAYPSLLAPHMHSITATQTRSIIALSHYGFQLFVYHGVSEPKLIRRRFGKEGRWLSSSLLSRVGRVIYYEVLLEIGAVLISMAVG